MGMLSSSWLQTHIFLNSDFCSDAHILSLATKTLSCFPLTDRLPLLIFEKMSAKCPTLNNHGLSEICSFNKNCVPRKKVANNFVW